MTISKAGNISGYKFMEAVIHSHARLTYNQVWAMVQNEPSDEKTTWRKQYAEVVTHVDELYRLFKLLRQRREARGALDFDSTETRIVFDSQRKIQQIVPVERNEAHMLIEECMLAANVCAANFYQRYKLPILYRVHQGPGEEKLNNLREFLAELGLSLHTGKGDPAPADYQVLLDKISERPDAHLIQTMLLRSLSQAVYQPENEGHFGLAFKAYTHFTSPIRRYSDLLVHRGIKSLLHSDLDSRQLLRAEDAKQQKASTYFPYDLAAMVHLGEHVSMTERRADDATREVVDFLKCEYIQGFIGETFEGTINTVTGFGMFVELKDIFVEGLVHVSNLGDDYYQFDAVKQRLVGERTRRVFRLGDSIWVRVMQVDLDERKIDFELVSAGVGAGLNSDKKSRKSFAHTSKSVGVDLIDDNKKAAEVRKRPHKGGSVKATIKDKTSVAKKKTAAKKARKRKVK